MDGIEKKPVFTSIVIVRHPSSIVPQNGTQKCDDLNIVSTISDRRKRYSSDILAERKESVSNSKPWKKSSTHSGHMN